MENSIYLWKKYIFGKNGKFNISLYIFIYFIDLLLSRSHYFSASWQWICPLAQTEQLTLTPLYSPWWGPLSTSWPRGTSTKLTRSWDTRYSWYSDRLMSMSWIGAVPHQSWTPLEMLVTVRENVLNNGFSFLNLFQLMMMSLWVNSMQHSWSRITSEDSKRRRKLRQRPKPLLISQPSFRYFAKVNHYILQKSYVRGYLSV